MTLVDVRKKLVELSGLYNLVTDYEGADYSDNGADFFIKSGQRWLDSLLETPQAPADYKVSLSAGEFSINVSEARAIQKVRLEESQEGIDFLDRKPLADLFEKWGDQSLLGEVDKGSPTDYALAIRRELDATTDPIGRTGQSGKKLFIMPPADKDYTIFVTGLFFSKELTKEDDKNFWSINYPDLLIQSALYKRESFMRNTSGLRDWRGAIVDAVNMIDADMVEEDIAEIDHMVSAWNFRDNMPRRKRRD